MTPIRIKPKDRRGFSFWIGVGLVALSFGVYPSYPTIALLPISVEAKVAGGVASWSISWVLFLAGSLLAGRAGRELFARMFAWRRAVPADRACPRANEPISGDGG